MNFETRNPKTLYSFQIKKKTFAKCNVVVDGSQNTRDFHFPLRIKAKISEYAPN